MWASNEVQLILKANKTMNTMIALLQHYQIKDSWKCDNVNNYIQYTVTNI